jgi:hypothetical protein
VNEWNKYNGMALNLTLHAKYFLPVSSNHERKDILKLNKQACILRGTANHMFVLFSCVRACDGAGVAVPPCEMADIVPGYMLHGS